VSFSTFFARRAIAGLLAICSFVALAPAHAEPVLIDFNELPNGIIPTPLVYPEVTISGGGFGFLVGDGRVCAFLVSDCARQVVLSFPTPVSGISFLTAGEGKGFSGVEIAVIRNGVAIGVIESPVDGLADTVDLHDISSFTNVTRLLLTPLGAGLGMSFDDFRFSTSSTPLPAIPEPYSLVLVLAGLGVGLARPGRAWRKASRQNGPG
jgi:hypothetical protein